MPRVARPIDLERIERLQNQIGDPAYLDSAIDRLAGRITDHLLDEEPVHGIKGPGTDYRNASSSRSEKASSLVDLL
jgi:hypothetical protein